MSWYLLCAKWSQQDAVTCLQSRCLSNRIPWDKMVQWVCDNHPTPCSTVLSHQVGQTNATGLYWMSCTCTHSHTLLTVLVIDGGLVMLKINGCCVQQALKKLLHNLLLWFDMIFGNQNVYSGIKSLAQMKIVNIVLFVWHTSNLFWP